MSRKRETQSHRKVKSYGFVQLSDIYIYVYYIYIYIYYSHHFLSDDRVSVKLRVREKLSYWFVQLSDIYIYIYIYYVCI